MKEIRNTQTRVKHDILRSYLTVWGGIISSKLQNLLGRDGWRFVYVDCFAYKGKYIGESESKLQYLPLKPVYGSPVIGVSALDKLTDHWKKRNLSIITNSILIEKDTKVYDELYQNLKELGWENRIRNTADFSNLKSGEIALINCNCLDIADDLFKFTNQNYTWTFYLLDPPGGSGIPYNFVKKIVSGKRHDVMINMIYEDLHKKSGFATKDYISPANKQQLDYWKKVYGDKLWNNYLLPQLKDINNRQSFRDFVFPDTPEEDMPDGVLSDEQFSESRERMFVHWYKQALKNMDHNLNIKLIDLKFPDKERTMLYLFLTTHDPTGALKLNEILWNAKLMEYEYRYRYNIAKRISRTSPRQLNLLDPFFEIPDVPEEKRPEIAEIANFIYEKFSGKDLTRKEIYSGLVDTLYFPREIDKALFFLKKCDKAKFKNNLSHSTKILFT